MAAISGSGLVMQGVDDDDDDKRWSLQEEISKLFNASLKDSFPDFEEEALIYGRQREEPGDYNCQYVLTLWPKIRKTPDELREKYSHIQESRHIGEAIKKNLPTYVIDMIDEEHSVQDSINLMLKDGIKTWAPKLPLERVEVVFPKLHEENCVDLFRRESICDMLLNLLKYSKVATDISLPMFEAGCAAETSKLLLCEATAVVMDKCVHLLGITPEINVGRLNNR